MKKRIAFVTEPNLPDLHEDDRLALPAFERRNAQVLPAIWDNHSIHWGDFDGIVVRSPWDYYRRWDEFREWIDLVEASGAPLLNPATLLRWNLDKRYLRDLFDAGVRMIPTTFINDGQSVDLALEIRDRGWDRAVIKPAISGGGDDLFVATPEEAETSDRQDQFAALVAERAVLIQPFMPQISAGEWSLLFYNGIYSHALLKIPGEGNYLVHEHWGGRNEHATATTDIIADASEVVRVAQQCIGVRPTYARVDGILVDGVFTLMELECLEPCLYHAYGGESATERFADAVLQSILEWD